MRKIINGILSLLLLITLCSCGTPPSEQSTTQDVDTASNAIFKNSETSAKENRLNNDFIRIWPEGSSSVDSPVWMQENLDGTGRKSINIEGLSYVLWVTNDWLYYSVSDDHQNIYRVPVEHKEEVTYDTARKEPLFAGLTDGKLREMFFVTDDFIFYSQFDEESELSYYSRYDLETGKNTKVFTLKSEDYSDGRIMQNECSNLPITLEDSFFLSSSDGIYRVSFDTLEPKKICTGKELFNNGNMVEHDGSVYFCGNKIAGEKKGVVQVEDSSTTILKYDGKSEEITTVLSDSDLKKVLEQIDKTNDINLIEKNCYYNINALYTYKDRLYIQIHTQAGARAHTPSSGKNVLLSAPFSSPDQWELERGLTEYCLTQGMGNPLGGKGSSVIQGIYNGKVLFTVTTEADDLSLQPTEGYCALYDIDTGKVEKLDEGDYRGCQYSY